MHELEAELGEWPIGPIDRQVLERAIAGEPGQPIALAALPFRYCVEHGRAAGLGVVIAEDEMRAWVVPTGPAIAAELAPEDVRAALASAGVVFGVQEHAIAQFVAQRPRVFPATVAVGQLPEGGAPPKIVPCVDTAAPPGEVVVRSGTPLLRLEQSEPDVPGMTVTGRELRPEAGPRPDLAAYAGPGTEVADDGCAVVAAQDGSVTFEGHRVTVTSLAADASAAKPRSASAAGAVHPNVVAGRPVFGPGKQWVEISALSGQIAKTRAAELLGARVEDLEAREVGGASSRWRSSESGLRRTAKRYRVQRRSIGGQFELLAEVDGLYLTVWPPEGSGPPGRRRRGPGRASRLAGDTGLGEPDPRGGAARVGRAGAHCPTSLARCAVWPWAVGHRHQRGRDVGRRRPLGALRRGVLDEATVRAALAQAGVRHGIIPAELTRFCRLEERTGLTRLAVGTPPGEVIDEPEYLFPRDTRAAPEVRPGTMLAWERTDVAAPGRTVTGKVVLAVGGQRRPLSDFIGEGAAIEARPGVPGDHAIVAATEGRPTVIAGRITVLKHEYVKERVEGNVAFAGSVTLAEVSNGATVKARGDLTLESDAEGVVLEAGGSVRVQGVEGKGKARIQSGDNVVASWLRGCLIMARETIHIGSLLAQSTIMSARRVVVGGEGTIRGGLVRATEEIIAQRILAGGEGNPTRIVLGRLRGGQDESSNARLIVHGEIEPGVRISIDGATMEVTEPLRRVVVRQRGGVIQVEPLLT